MSKYSIVMPVLNNLQYTTQAVQSVLQHSKDFELIIVDGGSTDGTQEWVRTLPPQYPSIHFLQNLSGGGFPTSINMGTLATVGQFIVWLNNDTIVTPHWLKLLSSAYTQAPKYLGVTQIGLVGPVSNCVGGRQEVDAPNYSLDHLQQFAEAQRTGPQPPYALTGFLSGFCLMISRILFEKIGLLDERFNPGGFEDNDYALRAQAAGYQAAIATQCFIHHFGSTTLNLPQYRYLAGGLANRESFYAKWTDNTPKKLIAAYRVRNQPHLLKLSLDAAARFADEIVVLCDRCTDNTPKVAQNHPKVVEVREKTGKFDELTDRVQLLQLANKHHPDWIITIDADEIYEAKFNAAYAQRLMHPPNPQIKAYGFRWCTLWNSPTHYRTDGIFGDIHGLRMFKAEPLQALASMDPHGFHMPSIPLFAPENFRWTNIRVKHLGYDTPKKRQDKYDFYSSQDTHKLPLGIGAEDYSHLIHEHISLAPWKEKNTLTLLIITQDDYHQLAEALDHLAYTADQIIIIDNSSDPNIARLAGRYNAICKTIPFRHDFAQLRNDAKRLATSDWILTIDPDEVLPPEFAEKLPLLLQTDAHGFIFQVHNLQPNGPPTTSEALRLFRNIPEFVYRGSVHENFDQAVTDHSLKILPAPFPISHIGYLCSPERRQEKLAFYRKLTRRDLRKDPKNKMALFNLALHQAEEGHPLKAIQTLEKAKSLDPNYFQPCIQLGVLHLKQAARNLEQAVDILNPNQPQYAAIQNVLAKVHQALQ